MHRQSLFLIAAYLLAMTALVACTDAAKPGMDGGLTGDGDTGAGDGDGDGGGGDLGGGDGDSDSDAGQADCTASLELCNGLDDDCDGVVDGIAADHDCEDRIANSITFCGDNGVCAAVKCRAGFAQCDGDPTNGCEPECECSTCPDGGMGGDGDGDGIPTNGVHLAACLGNVQCRAEFACYGDTAEAIGFCTERCSNDRDCTDIGGLLTLCYDGECAIDCASGVNGTNGECPENMVCNNRQWCNYPGNIGAVTGQWEQCSRDSDCVDNLTCEGASGSGLPGGATRPGYCTTTCSGDDDCTDDGGEGGRTACVGGSPIGGPAYCAIGCNNDKECPITMLCISSRCQLGG